MMQEISSKIDVLGKKYIENYASMKKIILCVLFNFFVINLFDLPGDNLLKGKGYKTQSLIEFPGH